MSTIISTRAEALAEGRSRYYTGRPCKHGHFNFRYTANAACVTCHSNNMKEYNRRKSLRVNNGKVNVRVTVPENHAEFMKWVAEVITLQPSLADRIAQAVLKNE